MSAIPGADAVKAALPNVSTVFNMAGKALLFSGIAATVFLGPAAAFAQAGTLLSTCSSNVTGALSVITGKLGFSLPSFS